VIVEDNPADSKTMGFAIASHDSAIEITVLENGATALEFFKGAVDRGHYQPCDLVLLDLNLPFVSGFEVLEYLKTEPVLKQIPVLVLSGSSSSQDVDRCYGLGANSYISKPTGIDDVLDMTGNLLSFWFRYAQMPSGNKALQAKHGF